MGSVDVINAAVNLAYLPEDEAKLLEFNPEYFIKKDYDRNQQQLGLK